MSCMKKATSNTIPRIIFTDADAALHNAIKAQFSDSQLASCIFHIKQNLKKNVRPKLQSDYSNFIVEFDKVRNSLSKQEFYAKWEALLCKYPAAQPYLHDNLYPLHYSWAKCYVNRIFNAGMQSTQRVEGMNSVLKRLIDRHSTLCELFHDIEKRIKVENFKDEFLAWNHIQCDSSLNSTAKFFPNIETELAKYLFPEIYTLQYQQIKDSFVYDIQQIYDYTAVLNNLEESFIDAKECNLESLLEDIDESSILELWQVKYAVSGSKSCNFIAILKDGSHLCTCLYIISRGLVCRHFFRVLRASNNAKFNIALIASRWYKDDISDNVEINHDSSMYSFNHIYQIRNTIKLQPNSKEHLSKRKRYGKIYGLARRVMQLAVDNDDQEPTQWMEQYIKTMEGRLEQAHQINSDTITEKENIDSESNLQNQINNPLVNKHTKGRPPKHARIKSVVEVLKENNQNKRVRRQCQNCKEISGHNSRSCPHPCGNCNDISHKIHQCIHLKG